MMTISRRTFLGGLAACFGVAATSAPVLAGISSGGINPVPKTGTWLLERGERVVTAGRNVRIVNAWDMSMIGDYMSSAEGEAVIMSAVRRRAGAAAEVLID